MTSLYNETIPLKRASQALSSYYYKRLEFLWFFEAASFL